MMEINAFWDLKDMLSKQGNGGRQIQTDLLGKARAKQGNGGRGI